MVVVDLVVQDDPEGFVVLDPAVEGFVVLDPAAEGFVVLDPVLVEDEQEAGWAGEEMNPPPAPLGSCSTLCILEIVEKILAIRVK